MIQHDHATCSKCHTPKPLSGFVADRSKSKGHSSQCKECRYPQSRYWKKHNCKRHNLAQRKYRKRVSSNRREIKQHSQGDVSWWEIFDDKRALRELNELGDGFHLMSKKLSRRSVLGERSNYSLEEIEGLIVDVIDHRELSNADLWDLSTVFIILKMSAQGIWINTFVPT
jgi:hypothetical protein